VRKLDPVPEPEHFDRLVRTPGREYLAIVPNPTTKQFQSRDYWTRVLGDLYDAYDGVCSYSCHWIPFDTGSDNVEHFRPKSEYPPEAYEWSNYRLVCQTLNARKGVRTVLDPFGIGPGWFVIEFPALVVKPHPTLDGPVKASIRNTCSILGLNDDATCLRSREFWTKNYCQGHIDYAFLSKMAPFLAAEITRQGYRDTLNTVMRYPPAGSN
jgi:hypothetical protein